MPPKSGSATSTAYLIVHNEVITLDHELTNIGRKIGNHIVIHDPRISRNHAQIRLIDGQYMILDMNSSSGVQVNGQPVSKSYLYSGDSISLAGVEIKFVQDTPRSISKAKERTGPMKKITIEEPPHNKD